MVERLRLARDSFLSPVTDDPMRWAAIFTLAFIVAGFGYMWGEDDPAAGWAAFAGYMSIAMVGLVITADTVREAREAQREAQLKKLVGLLESIDQRLSRMEESETSR